MSNKKIRINGSEIGCFDTEDVYDIKNPAYIVRQMEKGKKGGCVVEWNNEFERLTNFEPFEIDNAPCYEIFEGAQRREKKKDYVRICCEDCKFRTSGIVGNAYVLRNFWINSKYIKWSGVKYIKRRVDVYIFPFESERDKGTYALHILIDRGGVHAYKYFENTFMKIKSEDEAKVSINKLLKETEDRVNILEGLRIAPNNIDEIIKLIKTSRSVDNARQGLMNKFKLVSLQGEEIMDMKLQRLMTLEELKIQEEYKQLTDKIEKYKTILQNPREINSFIKENNNEVEIRCSKKEEAENKSRQDKFCLKYYLYYFLKKK